MHWTIKEADRNNVDFLATLLIGEVTTDVAVLEKLAARLTEAVNIALKLRED